MLLLMGLNYTATVTVTQKQHQFMPKFWRHMTKIPARQHEFVPKFPHSQIFSSFSLSQPRSLTHEPSPPSPPSRALNSSLPPPSPIEVSASRRLAPGIALLNSSLLRFLNSSLHMNSPRRHHRHEPGGHQCSSVLYRHIKAPVHLVHLYIYPLFLSPSCVSTHVYSFEL